MAKAKCAGIGGWLVAYNNAAEQLDVERYFTGAPRGFAHWFSAHCLAGGHVAGTIATSRLLTTLCRLCSHRAAFLLLLARPGEG